MLMSQMLWSTSKCFILEWLLAGIVDIETGVMAVIEWECHYPHDTVILIADPPPPPTHTHTVRASHCIICQYDS